MFVLGARMTGLSFSPLKFLQYTCEAFLAITRKVQSTPQPPKSLSQKSRQEMTRQVRSKFNAPGLVQGHLQIKGVITAPVWGRDGRKKLKVC